MNGEAIKEIERMADEARIVLIDGVAYSSKSLVRVIHDPRPEALEVETLKSLLDYLNNDLDKIDKDRLFVLVESFCSVSVFERLNLETMKRKRFIVAKLPEMEKYPFGHFIEHEQFIIKLRSLFQENDAQKAIIKYVSRISNGKTLKTEDDGITQTAELKTGLSGVIVSRDIAPVINTLMPYRTFREINQPESQFLFRMREGNRGTECALFEADGGSWRLDAVSLISKWIKLNLKEIPVLS